MKVKRVTPSPPGEGQRERGPGDGVSACRHRLCLGNGEKARAEGGAQGDPGQRGRLGEQCGRTPRVAPLAKAPRVTTQRFLCILYDRICGNLAMTFRVHVPWFLHCNARLRLWYRDKAGFRGRVGRLPSLH